MSPGDRPAAAPDPERDAAWRRVARRIGLFTVLILVALVAFGAWGAYSRHADALATTARVNAVPIVRTMTAEANQQARRLNLSGTMEPFDVATLYARATGYVAKRNADFGARVKAGDTLAVIAAPDLDQQRLQARAQLAQTEASLVQARATATLQKATNARTQILVSEGWQTKEQGDTDRLKLEADLAAVGVADANLTAQKANLSRLDQLTDFEKVVAPFDGVITDRQIDVGSLVSADTSAGTPLFSIARSDTLRIQVYVPQDAVFGLHDGTEAEITVPEMPGRVFRGKVSRTADALQEGTRTLLTQVDVNNADQALRSGLYCMVTFVFPVAEPVIAVPSQAVIFDHNGLSVAVVANGKLRLQPIVVGQDDGATLDVKQGLKVGDQVVLSPPVNVVDGMQVKAEPTAAAGGGPGA